MASLIDQIATQILARLAVRGSEQPCDIFAHVRMFHNFGLDSIEQRQNFNVALDMLRNSGAVVSDPRGEGRVLLPR